MELTGVNGVVFREKIAGPRVLPAIEEDKLPKLTEKDLFKSYTSLKLNHEHQPHRDGN